ncbi:glucose-1-phosphate cytidylyltransferase [Methylacidiphilum kamchatkense Kam1]|uniref:Glucose-1-phosphate cytidylyltransferase n=1 Tax=Methylacidiphilum kamchatkense Kam1 TaxID=1202785 RepID=A0A516TKU3_9BACT|nr:sugar phosphate nucleotidyltransferase [Methylacidiphilum kamchatkense]QDQ41868.1 glucose-1-phosphate cytidylyltransferase [Methylacidiphilum kamchatkense Kam1]
MNLSQIPIFVLCGGMGTRLREETEFKPKPMVTIGKHPILWHILQSYSKFGFRRFILCLGYKSEMIKSYFHNFFSFNNDCTINLKNNKTVIHESIEQIDWEVTMAYTGEKSMTGSRIAQAAKKYVGESEHFGVTYGDGLTDVNLADEFYFHLNHKKLVPFLESILRPGLENWKWRVIRLFVFEKNLISKMIGLMEVISFSEENFFLIYPRMKTVSLSELPFLI